MSLNTLKEQVLAANLELPRHGLVDGALRTVR